MSFCVSVDLVVMQTDISLLYVRSFVEVVVHGEEMNGLAKTLRGRISQKPQNTTRFHLLVSAIISSRIKSSPHPLMPTHPTIVSPYEGCDKHQASLSSSSRS